MTATRREAAQALHATIRQEVESLYISFPVQIVEPLGLIPLPDGTRKRGVPVGRAIVQPKMKRLWHNGKEIELPKMINVPAPPMMRGPFMHFGAFDNGQTVMVTVCQVALDMLLRDDKKHHPVFPRYLDMKDGWISSDAPRMNEHPEYPKEYLNDYGWVLLEKAGKEYKPVCKLIMRRNGQIRMEGRHLLMRFSEGIDMQELGGPKVTHNDGKDGLIDTVWSADTTSFKPGDLTGPLITDPASDPKAGG